MSDRFDAIVIGAGQSGPSLAVRLAEAGRRTAIIERKHFGGICVKYRLHADQDAHRERSETDGFIKALVDAETKQVLGAAMLGIEGDEVVHAVLELMYARAPYTVMQRAVHIHPTVTELLPALLGELQPLA